MPFMCGAVPSSLTVPVILPSPAALTFPLNINAPQIIKTIDDSKTAKLRSLFMIALLTIFLAAFTLARQDFSTALALPLRGLLLSRWGRGIGIDRLQSELFGHLFFLAVLPHEGSEIEDQIPSFLRFDVVGKGGHGSAVQSGHENPINVAIGVAALGPGTFGKVKGGDGAAEIIGEGSSRGTVGHTLDAVALPALHSGEHIAAGFDALRGDFGFGRDRNGDSRLFVRPAGRKVFDPSHQVDPFLLGQGIPYGHV